jgi:ParB/RepB/Spo0J family partition protein
MNDRRPRRVVPGDGISKRTVKSAAPPALAKGEPSGTIEIQNLPVDRIRPEEGLGRKRDRIGHDELCQSIQQFGVLTPVTVREAPDGSGDYLLVKGQGRTLACRRLGIEEVPAIVVGADFAEADKVQQFLVENVARLKMRPIDRALLISHARAAGEETASVARRFGISAQTVRKLEAQLDGATKGEIAALRAGNVNLSAHAVIARFVSGPEREAVIRTISGYGLGSGEITALFLALGWPELVKLGAEARESRLALFKWACTEMAASPRGRPRERLRLLAERLPLSLEAAVRKEGSA